ncbi:MAG: PEP-CTERM sorting domain-containing protein [Tepidisphaeraceae bacterium]
MKFALIATLGVAAFASASQAAVLVSADFNAPTYSDGALNTGADTTTPGQDGWITSSGGGTNNILVQNTATDGFVTMTTSGQDVRKIADNNQAINSGSAYLSAQFSLSAAKTNGDYFIHIGDGSTSNFYARIYAKSSGAGYVMAMTTSSGTSGLTYGTTVLDFNTTYTLLARYDFVSGATNDTGALFINPTTSDGSGDTAYATALTTGTDASYISSISLRQGSASNAPTVSFVDNISLSGNVVTLPEPASLGMLGLGSLVALRRRR